MPLSQYLCGIRPSYEGLVIEPRLPSHVKKAKITRKFHGVEYKISVENKKNDGEVTLSVTSGNAKVNGTTVKVANGEKEVSVKVVVG